MSGIRRLLIAHFADLAVLSSALNTRVINPTVPRETTKKTTQKFFQICLSNSAGSVTLLAGSPLETWQCKHSITQALRKHSVLTLMTSKCGLDCGTDYESNDCVSPSEFYMGLSP